MPYVLSMITLSRGARASALLSLALAPLPNASAGAATVHLPSASTTGGRPALIAEEILGKHGPVVAFVSGLGGDRKGWRTVAEQIAPCTRALIYDRPGIGDSKPVPQTPVIAGAVAEDLQKLLVASHLPGPYLLVGHSLGGLYVQSFARAHPSETAGIVLVDAMTPLTPPRLVPSTATELDGTAATAEDVGITESLSELRAGPPLPPVPLAVIVATRHNGTPEREAQRREVQSRTAALSPKGRLIVADGAGHFVQGDRPDIVVEAILDTLVATGADVSACRAAAQEVAR
jgi:pimeloyl-ACP methyl ester carboxylesterase